MGLLPVKEAKPVTVITAVGVVDAVVNPRVMLEAVEMRLLENETEAEVKAPAGAVVDGAAEDGEAVLVGEYEVGVGDVDAAITPELTPADAI